MEIPKELLIVGFFAFVIFFMMLTQGTRIQNTPYIENTSMALKIGDVK